jgi:PAS domain S-box-containing protein
LTEEPLPSSQPKILVVEDEQVVAMDLEASLQELGYQVAGVTSTGRDALELAREMCPDLVLMDIHLHGSMDGITAAAEIRRQWQIPVVFVTAFASEEILSRAKAVGPYGYLTKPFRTKELNATVMVALQQHRLTRSVFQEHGWLHTLLASMSDGVIATDAKGQVKFLNLKAEAITGWTLPEALGRPIEEVYPLREESGTPVEKCQLRCVLADHKPIGRQRFLLRTRSEQSLMVEDSAAPMHDGQGRLTGAVTVIVDITERQRAERERERLLAELARSNEDLSRFSYTVSHDLQGPVRTIRSFAELLQRRYKDQLQGDGAEWVQLITETSSGMQQLIKALLGYAQAGQAHLQRENIAVGEAVGAVRMLLASRIAETGAQITAGPLPSIQADPIQFQQLLQNLFSNALQYHAPNQPPRIAMTCESAAEGWTFSVADQGQGIPAEQLDRIFAPLTRLHSAEVGGTGLGLAICRTIVERHGGRIWAESEGAGQGATIRFFLPRPASAAQ